MINKRNQVIRAWRDSGLLDGVTPLFKGNIAAMLQGEATNLLQVVNNESKVFILTRQIEMIMRKIYKNYCQ